MGDLLKCPFCGSEPVSGVEFYEDYDTNVKLSATIKCRGCGIFKRKIFKATDISLVPFDVFINSFQYVAEAWNERVGENNDPD